MSVRKRYANGYTVIELMAVLAIASALLIVAIPMFRTQVQNARMTAATTDLLSTFMSARSEAVGRNYPVKVCIRTADAQRCAEPGVSDTNFGWERGWLSFVDLDDDGAVDGGEDIILIHPPLSKGMTARGTGTLAKSVTYRPNGLTDLVETRALVFCDARNYGAAARVLIVSVLGKVSVLKAEETDEDNCLREGP